MNKATRAKIKKFSLAKLTEIFGQPREDGDWLIPYGATGGVVSIQLYADDGSPWLACKLRNPIHVGPDGYTYPRHRITDWPCYFTYPSGKHNLHASSLVTFEEWKRELMAHLFQITAPGSAERVKVEEAT